MIVPDLYPTIFSLLDIRTKRLINKKLHKDSLLEYGLAIKFNYDLISYYFKEFEYPLFISKTYTNLDKIEHMIFY
jgi:hypothetical protein